MARFVIKVSRTNKNMKVCQGKELVITATENKLHNVHDTMNVQLTHQVFPCYQKRKLKRIYRSYSPLGIDSRTDVSPRPRVHYTDELKKTQRKQTSIFCWFFCCCNTFISLQNPQSSYMYKNIGHNTMETDIIFCLLLFHPQNLQLSYTTLLKNVLCQF